MVCQHTVSLVENCCRTAWARVPCHRQRNNPAKPEKGTQVLRPVPNMKNKCQELGFLASTCSQHQAQSSVSVPRRLTTKVTVLTMGVKSKVNKINVKNSESSHRLALSVEHSRVFRLQGDSLLMSLYLRLDKLLKNVTAWIK